MKFNIKSKLILIQFFLLVFNRSIFCNNILLISIPKCGTHLLAKAIELLSGKKLAGEFKPVDYQNNTIPPYKSENVFYRSHLGYNSVLAKKFVEKKFKLFFIYRDPRDYLISRAYWSQKYLRETKVTPLPGIEQCIDGVINKNLNKYYSIFMPWAQLKSVCLVRFENLIGVEGGGDIKLQLLELTKIAKFLGIPQNKINQSVLDCQKNLYGGTVTFREGKIGSWKKDLPKNRLPIVKKQVGKLLIDLGYEKNLNWNI